jgi:purine-cytosine permease-like protein
LISIPQLIISVLLFVVLFFGIGFLINMLLRATWVMAVIYPIIVIRIVDDVKFLEYFTAPITSFSLLGSKLIALQIADIIVLSSGLLGAIIAGFIIKLLRNNGYQMF